MTSHPAMEMLNNKISEQWEKQKWSACNLYNINIVKSRVHKIDVIISVVAVIRGII